MISILIVEDSIDTRDMIAVQLSGKGYAVRLAENRESALKQICAGYRPDIIIMDLMMPGMTIEEFSVQAKIITHSDAPMILETCCSDGQACAERLGAYYLPKPFSTSDLEKTIDLCLPELSHKG